MEHAHAKRLSWIAAIVVSACLCLAAWLISGWINRFGNDAMLTDVVLLPCSASQKVKVWENGVIYSDGTSLHALDGSGRQKWTYPVGTGLDFAVGDQTVAAWSGSTLALLDSKSGASLLTTTMSDPVLSACAGPTYAAVLTGEEHNATLNVLDLSGRQVDSISLASLTVLDFDFFSEGSMLWVMLLNTEGSQTMSMVSTYRPGRVQSGSITDTQQLVYHVSFTANSVQTVGTSYLKTYDYTGAEQTDQRKLLYGWTMLAADSSASSPLMVFAPENEVSTAATISDLRVISGGVDRIVRMPFPCYAVAARAGTLYGFSGRCAMVYRLSDKRAIAYTMPFETTSFLGLTKNQSAVLVSGDSVYLVSLP